MREETQTPPTCVYCKLPITREQHPAIQMKNGDQLHVECWEKRSQSEQRKRN